MFFYDFTQLEIKNYDIYKQYEILNMMLLSLTIMQLIFGKSSINLSFTGNFQ